ncbi:MAG: hypothetical protein V2A65_06630 [Candidatus Omnitrophota bacterium]
MEAFRLLFSGGFLLGLVGLLSVSGYAGTTKILQLSTEDYGIVPTQRVAFQAIDGLKYMLEGSSEILVDNATEDNYLDCLVNLYDYDILVLNDFRGQLLQDYVEDILKYVENGHGLLILGGYGAYGGRGKDYIDYGQGSNLSKLGFGDYRCIEKLLPVSIIREGDWVDQTKYPGEEGTYGPDKIRKENCPECGIVRMNFSQSLPVRLEGPDWMAAGNKVFCSDGFEEVAGCIPIENVSPSYHQVREKAGARVLARIKDDPFLVVQELGKGKIAALTMSDYRFQYYWPYTELFFQKIINYLGGKPKGISVIKIRVSSGKAIITIKNNSSSIESFSFKAEIFGPDNRSYGRLEKNLTLKDGQNAAETLPIKLDLIYLDGNYTIKAGTGDDEGFGVMTVSGVNDSRVNVRMSHKYHYARGEDIAPVIELEENIPTDKVTVNLELLDKEGKTIRNASLKPELRSCSATPISTRGLAFGEYKYVVRVTDNLGKTLAAQVRSVFVVKNPEPTEYIVSLMGIPTADDYTSLALLEQTAGLTNLDMISKLWKNDYLTFADYALSKVKRTSSFADQVSAYGPAGIFYKAHPDRIAWHKDYLDKNLKPYRNFPSMEIIYLDDEGNYLATGTEDERTEFKKIFGQDFPEIKLSKGAKGEIVEVLGGLDKRLVYADFLAYAVEKLHSEIGSYVKTIKPEWKVYYLAAPRPLGHEGNWIETTWKGMDYISYDVYPGDISNIGESLFFYNLFRSSGQRQNKPSYTYLGALTENLPTIKMQYWLYLGSGVKGGFCIYSDASSVWTNGILMDGFKNLLKKTLDYASLFSRWEKRNSRIGLLYSKSQLANNYDEPYETILENTCANLYRRDLYPDLLTEEDIRNGTIRNYDVFIIAGVEELPSDVVTKLQEYGRNKSIYLDETSRIDLNCSKKLDYDEIRNIITPDIITPSEDVFAELLAAGDLKYAVVYNHMRNERKEEIRIKNTKNIKAVYDLYQKKSLSFRQDGDDLVIPLTVPGFDGTIIVLLPAQIDGLEISLAGTGRRGSNLRLDLKVKSSSPVNWVLPVKIEIFGPDGEKTLYGKNILIAEKSTVVDIPLAENDAVGTWRVLVEELISGQKSELSFNVE